MAAGRCAGCGETASSRQVKIHILNCARFLELFREHPDRCLDPDAEFHRFRIEDDSPEARAGRRDERLRHRFAEQDIRQSREDDRWKPEPDILAY
jgi:hypothetical protein